MSAPAMSPAVPAGLYAGAPITEGVGDVPHRVHNMNISLDGYAAGEHVTFDAPIGGAEPAVGVVSTAG